MADFKGLWLTYYWITFFVSLMCLLRVPSKRINSTMDNIGGSVLCAMFGFVLWPLFVIATIKTKKGEPNV